MERAAAAEWGVGALAANPREEVPLLAEATARLACVDLDWEHVRAVDILAALRSFLPSGGSIARVTVYPSDYGLQRMAEEAAAGPQGIFRRPGAAAPGGGEQESGSEGGNDEEDVSEDEEEEEGSGSDDGEGSDGSGSGSGGEGGGDVDPERLRLYERSKLRWFYAVVDCDSPASAAALYGECDGMELMKSERPPCRLPACGDVLLLAVGRGVFWRRRISWSLIAAGCRHPCAPLWPAPDPAAWRPTPAQPPATSTCASCPRASRLRGARCATPPPPFPPTTARPPSRRARCSTPAWS